MKKWIDRYYIEKHKDGGYILNDRASTCVVIDDDGIRSQMQLIGKFNTMDQVMEEKNRREWRAVQNVGTSKIKG